MPFKTFVGNTVLQASEVNTYLMRQSVITCTSSTRPSTTATGMTIYETDTGRHMVWTGAAWSPRLNQDVTSTGSPTFSTITASTTVNTANLTVQGAGLNRSITINAPSGYYAIQYFAINGTNEWHYEVHPNGLSWSLVESGVAARITVTNTTATFSGTVLAGSEIQANNNSIRLGRWSLDTGWVGLHADNGYLLLEDDVAPYDENIYLRTFASRGTVNIGKENNNTLVVGTPNTYGATVGYGGFRASNGYSGYYVDSRGGGLAGDEWAFYATGREAFIYGAGINNFIGFNLANGYVIHYRTHLPAQNNVQWCGGVPAFGSNAFGLVGSYNFYNPSDERYKINREPLPLGMEFIRRLFPIKFNYLYPQWTQDDATSEWTETTTTGTRLRAGLSAQNVRAALDAVAGDDNYNFWALADKDDPESTQALDYTGFVAPLIQAVKELDQRVSQLEAQ